MDLLENNCFPLSGAGTVLIDLVDRYEAHGGPLDIWGWFLVILNWLALLPGTANQSTHIAWGSGVSPRRNLGRKEVVYME